MFTNYPKESVQIIGKTHVYRGADFIAQGDSACQPTTIDPRIESFVNELIGRVADKWTMLILEVLTEKGEVRFTRLSEFVPGISYKMLTQTLRQMEREGLVKRTVHPVVPPRSNTS